jgi:hypothetical protein
MDILNFIPLDLTDPLILFPSILSPLLLVPSIPLDLDKIINNPVNIVLAVIIVDIIALISARNNLVGKVINEWYDKFTIGAFTADVCSMIFLIYIALILFKYVLVPKFNIPFNLFTFLLSIVVIQMIHDFIFALIILKYPETQNDMVNVFKKYIDEGSYIILGVDASMMITSVLLISLFYYFDNSLIIYFLLSLALYFAMFLIYH